VDEKSQIQARDRTQPGLPLKKGRCGLHHALNSYCTLAHRVHSLLQLPHRGRDSRIEGYDVTIFGNLMGRPWLITCLEMGSPRVSLSIWLRVNTSGIVKKRFEPVVHVLLYMAMEQRKPWLVGREIHNRSAVIRHYDRIFNNSGSLLAVDFN
jgi:hypothetical protein